MPLRHRGCQLRNEFRRYVVVGVERHAPAALPPGKSLGAHCTGGFVGPRTGLLGYGEDRISYPTAVRTQSCPACNELLCRLYYPRPIRDVSLPKSDVKTS